MLRKEQGILGLLQGRNMATRKGHFGYYTLSSKLTQKNMVVIPLRILEVNHALIHGTRSIMFAMHNNCVHQEALTGQAEGPQICLPAKD